MRTYSLDEYFEIRGNFWEYRNLGFNEGQIRLTDRTGRTYAFRVDNSDWPYREMLNFFLQEQKAENMQQCEIVLFQQE